MVTTRPPRYLILSSTTTIILPCPKVPDEATSPVCLLFLLYDKKPSRNVLSWLNFSARPKGGSLEIFVACATVACGTSSGATVIRWWKIGSGGKIRSTGGLCWGNHDIGWRGLERSGECMEGDLFCRGRPARKFREGFFGIRSCGGKERFAVIDAGIGASFDRGQEV